MHARDFNFNILSFDRTDHNASYEILLDKRIDTQNRKCCNNDGAVLNESLILIHTGRCIIADRLLVALDQYLTKNNLQRIQITVSKINHCVEVFIPLLHCIEQCDNGKRSFAQRHNYLNEDGDMSRAVKLGRLLKTVWKRYETGSNDYQVKDHNRLRNKQRPAGIDHTALFDNKVCRNETALEKHSGSDHDHEVLEPHRLLAGNAVSAKAGEKNAYSCTNSNIEYCVSITFDQAIVGKYDLISLCGKRMCRIAQRPKNKSGALSKQRGVTDRSEYNVDDGRQTDARDNNKNDSIDDLEHYAAWSLSYFHFFALP